MNQTTEPRRLKRLWMPIAILLLGVGGMTALVLTDSLEPVMQFFVMTAIVLGTPLLLIFWLMFLSGVTWRRRFLYLFLGCLGTVGILFGLSKILRMDGSISGSGLPRLAFAWTPSHEASLVDLKVERAETVDLSHEKDTDSTQFLGRNRDNVAIGVRLNRDWKAHPPKELWRKSIGLGWSGFAVAGDFAVTQEQREDKELVVCYELKTGKVRWKHEHEVRLHDPQGGDGPRATPTIVEGKVYTLGGTGILDCIDGDTGENIWSRDTLGENDLKKLIWGQSCSPLILDDKVIVTGGLTKRDSLLAYDKKTGVPVWKVGEDEASYNSPVLAKLDGEQQILSVNAHSVTGHDPKDGKILWTFPWPEDWAKVSQPVPLPGDRVFLSAGYGVGCVMLHITRGSDGQWAAEKQWATRKMRTQFSNVAIARGCAFGLDDRYLACVDLKTGKQKWKGKRYNFGQVLLAGDTLLVQAEDGNVVLVEANPEKFVELARLPALHSKTWNNPVLSGRYLLVRNDCEAVCYEMPVEESER